MSSGIVLTTKVPVRVEQVRSKGEKLEMGTSGATTARGHHAYGREMGFALWGAKVSYMCLCRS